MRMRWGTVSLLDGGGDLQFPWRLRVFGVDVPDTELLFEQWMRGGYTIFFEDGKHQTISALERTKEEAQKRAVPGRGVPPVPVFNGWVEDRYFPEKFGRHTLLQEVPRGPAGMKYVAGLGSKGCTVKSERRYCRTYEFDDTPGVEPNKTERRGRLMQLNRVGGYRVVGGSYYRIVGVEWSLEFHHKLRRAGQKRPFYEIQFKLSGGKGHKLIDKRRVGIGARKIVPLEPHFERLRRPLMRPLATKPAPARSQRHKIRATSTAR